MVQKKKLKNVFPNRFVLYINKSCGIFKFAVPYKLFESLGYGCPLLGTNHTMTGDFISEKK